MGGYHASEEQQELKIMDTWVLDTVHRASQEGCLSHSILFMVVIYLLRGDPICLNIFNVRLKRQNDAP